MQKIDVFCGTLAGFSCLFKRTTLILTCLGVDDEFLDISV